MALLSKADMEEGNLTDFTSTFTAGNATVSATSGAAYGGSSYGLRCYLPGDGDGERAQGNLYVSTQSPFYYRFWFSIEDLTMADGDDWMLVRNNENADFGAIWLRRSGTAYQVRFSYYDGALLSTSWIAINKSGWNKLAFYFVAETGSSNEDGILQAWVNDSLELDISDATGTDSETMGQMQFGARYGLTTTTNGEIYIDDVEIHDSIPSSDTELVVADIGIDLAYDAPVLTQAHVLAVNDASLALAFDAPVLTQANTLVVADVDIDLAFDGAGAGDGLWDIGAYIYPLGGDGIILVETEATSLTVSDISLALAFDAPVLTQAHTLVVADAALDLAFEAPVLTSVLVVDDVAIALSFESMALTQAHTLVTDDVVFALSFENIALGQTNTLSVSDASFALAFEAPVLTQSHTLVVDNTSYALAFDAPVLTQAHLLEVADMALALAFDTPLLTGATTLVVADITHALAFEEPVLTTIQILAVDDVALALAFDAPVLTQAHTLTVEDAAINLAFESPAASEDSNELVVGTATVITLKAVIVT